MQRLTEPTSRDQLTAHLAAHHGHLFHRLTDRYNIEDDPAVLERAHVNDHGHDRGHVHLATQEPAMPTIARTEVDRLPFTSYRRLTALARRVDTLAGELEAVRRTDRYHDTYEAYAEACYALLEAVQAEAQQIRGPHADKLMDYAADLEHRRGL